jgi:hypothetical protein
MEAAQADPGISPLEADASCKPGSHKIALGTGNAGPGPDFHWFRQGKDGSWCYKFKQKDPTNIGGDEKPIMDLKKGDTLNFPGDAGHQPSSYTICGFLCASDSGK